MYISIAQARRICGPRDWRPAFPCKFPRNLWFMICLYIFRFLRLPQYAGRRISVRHFPYKFQRKLHFGKYRYIFRLRRFAQNVGAGLESRIFSVNFHIKWLLGNVLIYFDRAGSHKVRFPVLRSIVFLLMIMFLFNFRFIIFPSPSCS